MPIYNGTQKVSVSGVGKVYVGSTLVYQKTSGVLDSISLSGSYPTTFYVNDTFDHTGVIVTATYTDSSTAIVTNSAIFSNPDMTTVGTKTVTVSYTEGGVTKTTSYTITVQQQPQPGSVTVTKSVSDLATQYSWTNGQYVGGTTVLDYWYLDYDATTPIIEVNGKNDGTSSYYSPKYYLTSGVGNLRCYGTDVSSTSWVSQGQNYMLIWLSDSTKVITKVTITCASGYGTGMWLVATDGSPQADTPVQLTSGTEHTLTTPRRAVAIMKGDTSTGAPLNGNIRITNISVTYE